MSSFNLTGMGRSPSDALFAELFTSKLTAGNPQDETDILGNLPIDSGEMEIGIRSRVVDHQSGGKSRESCQSCTQKHQSTVPSRILLDVPIDDNPLYDGFGAPEMPHNTPASISDKSVMQSSDFGSCHDEDSFRNLSAPKAGNFHFDWFQDEFEGKNTANVSSGDGKMPQARGRVFRPANNAFRHDQQFVDTDQPKKLGDGAPPRTNPRFFPPDLFKPTPVEYDGNAVDQRVVHFHSGRPKKPFGRLGPAHRRHVQRLSPYRNAANTYQVPVDPPRKAASASVPSLLQLSFGRGKSALTRGVGQLGSSAHHTIDRQMLASQMWSSKKQDLERFAAISLFINKSPTSTHPLSSDSRTYMFHVQMAWSITSKSMQAAKYSDKSCLTPPDSPADGSTNVLQLKLTMPLLFLRIIMLINSAMQKVVSSALVSKAVDCLRHLLLSIAALIIWLLSKLHIEATLRF